MRGFFLCIVMLATSLPGANVQAASGVQAKPMNRLAQIPTVSGRLFEKQDRLELTLWLDAPVDDPFYYHAPVGLALGYHFAESLSVGIRGDYWLSIKRGPMSSPGNVPSPDVARPMFEGFGEIIWAPVYGKWSLLSSFFVHFDAHVKLGGGVVGGNEGQLSPLITAAVGQRYRVADWFVLSVEIRERVMKLQRVADIQVGSGWEYFLSVGVGASFMLGGNDS